MADIHENIQGLARILFLYKDRDILRQFAGYQAEILDLVGFRDVKFQLAQENPLEPCEVAIVFRAVDDSVEWLCGAILLQVATLRFLSKVIRGQQNYEMSSRVHDLIQSLFLGKAKEAPDVALFRPPANVKKR